MYRINKPPPKDILSAIPTGEKIVWYGRPDIRRFCLSAMGLKYVLVYLLFAIIFDIYSNLEGPGISSYIGGILPYILSFSLALILLVLIGISQVVSTFYVITSKRIIIKSGVALIFMLNVPFSKIYNIQKQELSDGTGSISLELLGNKRIPFFACWPSVRPWYFNNPQPTFRCISDVNVVALYLSKSAQARVLRVKSELEEVSDLIEEKEEVSA